jgi:hypothetical protein
MTQSDRIVVDTAQQRPTRKARLWLWFLVGFALVFIGASLTIRMATLTTAGDAVVACKLWKYYAIEIPRALRFTSTLGPTSGGSSALLETAFQHLLISAIGGAVMLGVGLVVHKLKGRRS